MDEIPARKGGMESGSCVGVCDLLTVRNGLRDFVEGVDQLLRLQSTPTTPRIFKSTALWPGSTPQFLIKPSHIQTRVELPLPLHARASLTSNPTTKMPHH
jgi:hypothetical protein